MASSPVQEGTLHQAGGWSLLARYVQTLHFYHLSIYVSSMSLKSIEKVIKRIDIYELLLFTYTVLFSFSTSITVSNIPSMELFKVPLQVESSTWHNISKELWPD